MRTVDIRAPATEVFEMFTDPAELVRWIGIRALLEPKPGGNFRSELMPGEFCSGRQVELVPGRRCTRPGGGRAVRSPSSRVRPRSRWDSTSATA